MRQLLGSSMSSFPKRMASFILSRSNSSRNCIRLSASVSFSGSQSDHESEPDVSKSNSDREIGSAARPLSFERPLENGVDQGVYKAILVGRVGQNPIQKRLKNGRLVTLLTMGTGGIRNNRRPFDNEDPQEYANRCAVQWHRVCIYPERLAQVAHKHGKPGSVLYLEGNLETKIFTDPITGLMVRIREVAVRRDGRLVFLGQGDGDQQVPTGINRVGYF